MHRRMPLLFREGGIDFELVGCEVIGGASTPFSCLFLVANRSGVQRSISLHRDDGQWS